MLNLIYHFIEDIIIKLNKLFLLLILPLFVTGCGNTGIDYGTAVYENVNIYAGYDGVALRPTLSNPSIYNQVTITYTSSDENACYIDEDNKVRYVGPGYSIITADCLECDDLDGQFYVNTYESFGYASRAESKKVDASAAEENTTLFMGDSYMEFWRYGTNDVTPCYEVFSEYNVCNIGIGGTRTNDWRAMAESVVGLVNNPKNIIINIGVNNINNGDSGSKCANTIQTLIIDLLEMFENVNIYYFSIVRCTSSFGQNWNKAQESNASMKSFCKKMNRVNYLDVVAEFGNDYKDYLVGDGLHLNQAAYDVYRDLILENVSLEKK